MELEKEIMDIDTLYYLNDDVIEKMNDYYFQKKEYDDKLKKNKKKDRSYKPKCIFCDKIGGTIFKTELDMGSRVLTARCGNKTDPCSNEIIINTGRIELFSEKINLLENNIEKIKKKIIYYKNDLLFGYIEKISPIFDELKIDIETNTLQLHYIKEHYIDRVENPEDYDKLLDLEKGIYENINEIKLLLNQNDPDNVSGVIEIYKNRLLPSLYKTIHLKYYEPEVIYEEDENCYRLLETPKKYKIKCNEFSQRPITEMINIKPKKVKKVKKPTSKPKLEEEVPEINLSVVDQSVDKGFDKGFDKDLEEAEIVEEEEPEEDEIKFVPFKKISFEKERSVKDPEIDEKPEFDELHDMPDLEEVDFDAVDVE
jgi:hypothetical protein